jgi:hypothetical protein
MEHLDMDYGMDVLQAPRDVKCYIKIKLDINRYSRTVKV